MKPAPFEYYSPTTIDETVSLLSEYENTELLAGNQSLALTMGTRLAKPDNLIDLNDINKLKYIDEESSNVKIGAMTRHRTIAESGLLQHQLPMLPESAAKIAGPAVQNLGTLGGNLGVADPGGNYPVVLTTLDASLALRSVDGEREVSVQDFFIGSTTTDLREDELIERATISTDEFPIDRSGMAFRELKEVPHTTPKLSAAGAVRVSDPTTETPRIEEARLGLGNAANIPLRVEAAEDAVKDEPLSEETLKEAATAAINAAEPTDELHADVDYKQNQVGVYTRRALQTAYDRAIEG